MAGRTLTVEVEGKTLRGWQADRRTCLFELPSDLVPGREVALAVAFASSFPLNATNNSAISSLITPRLWWGFGTLDDYEVRLTAPEGYVCGAPSSATRLSLIWRGHLLDVLGRRAEAVAAYRTALALPGEIEFSHTQWSMTIDRQWVEGRLKTSFERK